jgi:translation elongation factor EF-Ts
MPAQKLPKQFDQALIRFDQVYIYDGMKVIEQLIQEYIDEIKLGNLPIYSDGDTIEQSAYTYAVEDFFFNYHGAQGPDLPTYIVEQETED